MSLRRRVLRADVTRSLAEERADERLADERLQELQGIYNVHPLVFVFGALAALFSVLFALYAAQREAARQDELSAPGSNYAGQVGAPSAIGTTGDGPEQDKIWIDVEP